MLFYSHIAWLLLLCFVFQTVFFYTGMLESFVLDVENSGRTYWCSLRLFIRGYGGSSGLWPSVVNILYLYIPLLTMGVISKELSSGSIKLLYSSPISNTHIVLGKFLAMRIEAFIEGWTLFLSRGFERKVFLLNCICGILTDKYVIMKKRRGSAVHEKQSEDFH